MALHVDHKGKYFTDIISKDVVRTVIQTLTVRIIGDIYVRQGERFKDDVNRSESFMAVTDAEVLNARGEKIYNSEFLILNLENVLWMSPIDASANQSSEG